MSSPSLRSAPFVFIGPATSASATQGQGKGEGPAQVVIEKNEPVNH